MLQSHDRRLGRESQAFVCLAKALLHSLSKHIYIKNREIKYSISIR